MGIKIRANFAKTLFMSTFLFDKFVFGPVYSRRLGTSLGINLLPNNCKYCNFNCIYCECGWTENRNGQNITLPAREEIKKTLSEKLQQLRGTINEPDAITFAGNGEPTIHPDFAEIIEDTIDVRDRYSPHTIISVLSNASLVQKSKVKQALKKVDKNILKLDTAIEETFQLINQPIGDVNLNDVVDYLESFNGKLIVQTLFLRGEYNGTFIDNTSEKEINAWLPVIKRIKPQYVMIYPIDRGTPSGDLEKIPESELKSIANRVEKEGVKTEVFY